MAVTMTEQQYSSLTNQAIRRLVPRLAAYLPNTLTRQILQTGLPQPGKAQWLMAATLFTDMSGFTAMTEELAAAGPRGAEELNRTLLMTFTSLINGIHTAGGAVCHFHGDAMTVFFVDDDGQAAVRALACARFLQSLMQARAQVEVRSQSGQKLSFDLTMRIGVGYGRCLAMVVGDPKRNLEFVLAGTAVDEAVAAEGEALAGQVIASQAVLQQAGWPAESRFREVTEMAPVPNANSPIYWDAHSMTEIDRLAAIAPAFIHRNLYDRLLDSNTQYIAEHRSITSLFVRFDGIDYDDVHADEKLQTYYEWAWGVITRYSGNNSRLNRLLTGDKGSQLHILFGAPVAPDTPDQALRCALALQREKPDFITQQQIGVAAGRAFACAVGSQNRREYTAVGRVVNLSARLAQICPNGAILTDEVTAQRTSHAIKFDTLSPTMIKGFQKPIHLYQAIRQRTPRTRLLSRFEQPLEPPPGRESETNQLLTKLYQAFAGQGRLIALSGEMGSGQSQLLSIAVHTWLNEGGMSYMGVGQPQQHDVSFAPWQSVWRNFFGLTPDMPLMAQMTAVSQRLQSLSADFVNEDVSLWGQILGLSQQFGQMPIEVRHIRFFELAGHYLQLAAAQCPILIVLEDMHFADQLSLGLLNHMAQAVKRQQILLLFTFRPSSTFTLPTLQRSICTHIQLEDLPPEQAKRVVQQILGADVLPLSLERRLGIRDRDGRTSPVNPLFLVESLKLLQAQNVLEINGNGHIHVDEARLAQLQVPDTAYAISLARLDQLSATSRILLQTAAVIGREFNLSTLIALTPGLTEATAIQLLAGLQQAGFIHQAAQEPEPIYMFQRALSHNTIYQSLPYARRQTIHAAVADWLIVKHKALLPPHYPVLAYHYGQTDRHEDGIRFALLAAQAAEVQYAHTEAVHLYGLALKHMAVLSWEAQWQTAVSAYRQRAAALYHLGEFNQALQEVEMALKLARQFKSTTIILALYNLKATIFLAQARYHDVLKLTAQVTDNPANRNPEILAEAYLLISQAANGLYDHDRANVFLEKGLEICQLTGDQAQLVEMKIASAQAQFNQLQLNQAIETGQQAVALARQMNLPIRLGLALEFMSQAHLRLGQPDEALTAVSEAIHLVQTISANITARSLGQRTAVHLYMGQLAPAYSDLREATRLLANMDDPKTSIQLHLLWQAFYQVRGNLDEAQVHLSQAHEYITQQTAVNATNIEAQIRLWLATAQVAHHRKQPDQAKTQAQLALNSCEAHDLLWWLPAAAYWYGMAQLSQNEDEANVAFQRALDAMKRGGNPDILPLVSLQLALLEKNDERREKYLVACIKAANIRAIYRERIACFRVAGPLLTTSTNAQHRQMGEHCLHLVEWFDAEVSEP